MHLNASIAQMVERKTLNLVVVGSIPTGGAFAGSSPGWASSAHRALGSHQSAALAQLVERGTVNAKQQRSLGRWFESIPGDLFDREQLTTWPSG